MTPQAGAGCVTDGGTDNSVTETRVSRAATQRGVHDRLATLGAAQPNSYAPGHTLPLRVEVTRQLTRRRTHVVAGLLAILPVVIAAALRIGGPVAPDVGTPQIVSLATSGAFNFALFVLLVSSGFLLVVIVALFAGDTVASEASWSSLRYLLAQPVPRARLLRQKLAVAIGLSATAVLTYVAWSLVVGGIAFGFATTRLPIGPPATPAQAIVQIAVVVGYVCLQLLGTAAFAFFLSTRLDNPLGAVGGAVMLSVVTNIFDQIGPLGSLRNVLLGHWDYAWFGALNSRISYHDMTRGLGVTLFYVALFLGLSFVTFDRMDITS